MLGKAFAMSNKYSKTITCCLLGYVVQAIINNYVPLLFVTFNRDFGVSLEKISLIITINFAVQISADLISSKFIDKIGYRMAVVVAHAFSFAGLLTLAVLPNVMDAYTGLVISTVVCAMGGGLIEVIISPIVEACPSENKAAHMSLLHSFYCWGHVAVVLISTLFIATVGTDKWYILAAAWAILPLVNGIAFCYVPILTLTEEGKSTPLLQLMRTKTFWAFIVIMVCAGACELSVSQWASAFAEAGLGVSKTVGDLAGPMAFAILMGGARIFYSRMGNKIRIEKYLVICSAICLFSYLLIALSPYKFLSLVGCGICGFAVGVMWPGSYSMAAAKMPGGGAAMFAMLAFAGDTGCAVGPGLVGAVSERFSGDLKTGILAVTVFPVVMLFSSIAYERKSRK